ncbi:MAG: class I SAM-dependent methyltransferase [Enterocloster citroniae]|nr:class I SAM-dependent methyltransferase [Enterocloster citroniae]
MNLMSKFFNNTRKPEGFLGKMMVNGMNGGGHAALAEWSLSFVNIDKNDSVLDCGCGGGANVKRLLAKCDTAYGIDYSEISVAKSKEVNAEAIKNNRCEIHQCDVCSLPFDNDSFNMVTAFETVYFWQDIEKAFAEIFRVLRNGGTFAITNESTGTDKTSVKFSEIIDGMNLYTSEDLKALLEKAGFTDIQIHAHDSKPWLNVTARKAN